MSACTFTDGLDETLPCECANCDWHGTVADVEAITDVQERVCAGETVPAGQCPECGCLAHLIETKTPRV